MKIFLEKKFLNLFKNQNFKSKVQIIKITGKSTIISINGHNLEIPFVLKENANYTFSIQKGILEIKEKNFRKIIEKFSDAIIKELKENLDNFFLFIDKKDYDPKTDINSFLYEIPEKKDGKRQKNNKNKNYFFVNDKKDFFFIFNLPFYLHLARVFIKINHNRQIYINIHTEAIVNNEINKKNFLDEIKNKLSGRSNNLFVNITDKKDEFYNIIGSMIGIKTIDIEI